MDNEKMFELMSKMYSEMQNGFKRIDERFEKLETKVGNLEVKVDKLEVKVDNNTVLLEQANHNIKLLSEGHENIVVQMESKFAELENTIEENYSLHDKAIKEVSKTASKGEKAYNTLEGLTKSFSAES